MGYEDAGIEVIIDIYTYAIRYVVYKKGGAKDNQVYRVWF